MSENIENLKGRFEELKNSGLNLDITRGQPADDQFDLSLDLITALSQSEYKSESGVDCRNYPGGVCGLKEARKFFGEVLGASAEETIVGNNSSLLLMNDVLRWYMLKGAPGVETPWFGQKAKIICPVPGYDRHFTMLETLGIEMITTEMDDEGPVMSQIEELVKKDKSIKGIVLVPQYSNPTGITFSDEVVDRLSQMKTAAEDFTIFWDNAYAIHHIVEEPRICKNLLLACKDAGNANRALMFSSTSKVTFAGAGLGFMSASIDVINYITKLFSTQFIGPDKFNQLRHLRFFEEYPDGLPGLMKRHAASVGPKFEAVQEILAQELGGTGLATWTQPEGGYFVSLDTKPGLAKRVVELASQAGVKLTAAGATFPGNNDPEDKNIRIAPTRPPLEEVKKATQVLAVCIKLASAEG